ncbi:predicted protein [Postia placenta Mad-698-R]|uniref:Uncharacterized protein n=1 Tax=Postia placenta MAD-698-R-SB12 TaxID=670580 RepID=A0A1X6MPL6_9APHY|nr:hypothetical protein POSPLADRAFT_1049453 [Postia placenta MAD-698-R-SB12]EED79786.1 predicted protein [Postia placenta Mad-698-R]OSX58209.1 hypothetical protein POSPLADRAFT_1049453 [Postia placenta MAD-698-R-SB12]
MHALVDPTSILGVLLFLRGTVNRYWFINNPGELSVQTMAPTRTILVDMPPTPTVLDTEGSLGPSVHLTLFSVLAMMSLVSGAIISFKKTPSFSSMIPLLITVFVVFSSVLGLNVSVVLHIVLEARNEISLATDIYTESVSLLVSILSTMGRVATLYGQQLLLKAFSNSELAAAHNVYQHIVNDVVKFSLPAVERGREGMEEVYRVLPYARVVALFTLLMALIFFIYNTCPCLIRAVINTTTRLIRGLPRTIFLLSKVIVKSAFFLFDIVDKFFIRSVFLCLRIVRVAFKLTGKLIRLIWQSIRHSRTPQVTPDSDDSCSHCLHCMCPRPIPEEDYVWDIELPDDSDRVSFKEIMLFLTLSLWIAGFASNKTRPISVAVVYAPSTVTSLIWSIKGLIFKIFLHLLAMTYETITSLQFILMASAYIVVKSRVRLAIPARKLAGWLWLAIYCAFTYVFARPQGQQAQPPVRNVESVMKTTQPVFVPPPTFRRGGEERKRLAEENKKRNAMRREQRSHRASGARGFNMGNRRRHGVNTHRRRTSIRLIEHGKRWDSFSGYNSWIYLLRARAWENQQTVVDFWLTQDSEAHGLQQTLAELLKTRDPWDKEVEFSRKNLRRQYLRLLFAHPYATESRDVDTHLWRATSYPFIARYKEGITSLDRTIYGPPREQQPRQQGGQQRVVEYRKLLQRFRQFLSEEEKFWVQLITRIRRVFALDDAQRALTALSIVPDDTSATATTAEGPTPRRNQHQFPPESNGVLAAAVTASSTQRQNKMTALGKALVRLGDIERYKEQYNEAGGRPRAGHEDGPPAVPQNRGRSRRGGSAGAGAAPAVVMPRMRNYEKAEQCYRQARLLMPHDGNSSHGLAILALYKKDKFDALVQYYRALCVRAPYEAAAENMQMTLNKALETWKGRQKERVHEEVKASASAEPPRVRVAAFEEKLVALHALFQTQCRRDDPASSLHVVSQQVTDDFKGLVSDRVLPAEMISKVIIMAQGALWRYRSTRQSSSSSHRRSSATSITSTESHIATHLLATHRALLEVGVAQLAEAPEDPSNQDLAQKITAELRRTLPALRLASKWSLGTAPGEHANGHTNTRSRDRRDRGRRSTGPGAPDVGVREFWNAFMQFSSALSRTFPLVRLPPMAVPFEEDVELGGFQPLKTFVSSGGRSGNGSKAPSVNSEVLPEQVHPNEEQLMRIRDLLMDAQALAAAEETPFVLDDGRFEPAAGQPESKPVVQHVIDTTLSQPARTNGEALGALTLQRDSVQEPPVAESDDDSMAETSRTDDDPVGDAFREALNGSDGEDEDDQDEIVWNLGTPTIPTKALVTTAEDLLKGLQRVGGHTRMPSAPQSQLLFGSGASGTSPSIWSTALDGNALKFQGAAAGTTVSQLYPLQQPNTLSQSPFTSPRSQSNGPDVALPVIPAQQPATFPSPAHQRVPSLSQGLPSLNSSQPFGFSGSYSSQTYPSGAAYSTGVPSAYADPVYPPASVAGFRQQYPPGYPMRPINHTRIPSVGQHTHRYGVGGRRDSTKSDAPSIYGPTLLTRPLEGGISIMSGPTSFVEV